jgi:pimeloyl-ACP methyl ester carboxylesterase
MRPVLLLHGALGSKTQLDLLKDSLQASGLAVYSMNFSGHSGKPFAADFGIETFANDIVCFLKENQLNQVDIFGYSMGGYVALWLAHAHPEYTGKIITLGTKFDWSPEAAAKEVKKVDPEKIQEKIPAFARILQHRHEPNDWNELLHKTAAMMTALGNKPLLTEAILQQIKNDVLILLGDLDDMTDLMFSKKVSEALPHGKFSSLEKTPHPIERVDVKFLHRVLLEKFQHREE